ncbi:MAG: hypothetical protein ABUL62_24755 [Myxococcales bacterium]
MSKRSWSGGRRRVSRARVVGYTCSLVAVVAGCGGTVITASDEQGGAGSAGRGASAGSAGYAGGAPGFAGAAGGSTPGAGAPSAGAPSAGAPSAGAPGAGAGGAFNCAPPETCDDGNPCTIDGCDNGLCRHQLVDVNDGNACTTDSCNPMSGVVHTAIPLDDHNACTKDSCDFLQGVSHYGFDISDQDACTVDSCDPNTGIVTHQSLPIDDMNPCTFDSCNPTTGIVGHFPQVFDDGNACTLDQCDPVTGTLLSTPVDCNDGDPCTSDSCDPASGCLHTGGLVFSEGFSSNQQGWELGVGWQIGPAKPSFGQATGNPDPALDHSASSDNGLAGVVIGGNVGTVIQGPSYLTSPVINLSATSAVATLEYWRWLNSDYLPYMDSTIEVFDGVKWIRLFAMPINTFVMDDTWTRYQFDVTPYKNPSFRVRWGFLVGSPGVLVMSGWNIDDVRVTGDSPSVCL